MPMMIQSIWFVKSKFRLYEYVKFFITIEKEVRRYLASFLGDTF